MPLLPRPGLKTNKSVPASIKRYPEYHGVPVSVVHRIRAAVQLLELHLQTQVLEVQRVACVTLSHQHQVVRELVIVELTTGCIVRSYLNPDVS